MKAPARFPQLDVLRGVAVLMVVGHHIAVPAPEVAEPLKTIGWTWYYCGWTGVELFFVLSGFLVSSLFFTEFQRHGNVRVAHFLVRRGFKIYPPFYLMLLAVICYLHPSGPALGVVLRRVRNEVVFLQNYLGGLLPHTWTLAIEEQFYFVLAALIALLVRTGRGAADPFRPLAYLVPLVGAGALGLRSVSAFRSSTEVAAATIPYPLHYRVDALFWGVLLGYWYHWRDRGWLRVLQRYGVLVLPVAALLLVPAYVWPVGHSKPLLTVGLTSLSLGFVLLLALVLPAGDAGSGPPRRGLLATIGADSYSIYLWHLPLFLWVMGPLDAAGWFTLRNPTLTYAARFGVFLVAGVTAGIGMARLIERPSLALRDRLFPSRSGALAGEEQR